MAVDSPRTEERGLYHVLIQRLSSFRGVLPEQSPNVDAVAAVRTARERMRGSRSWSVGNPRQVSCSQLSFMYVVTVSKHPISAALAGL